MARRRRSTRRSSNYVRLSYLQVFLGAFALLAGAFVFNNKLSHGRPNVLGVATSAYRSYTVNWIRVPNAKGYNIYYKAEGEKNWTNAVRNLSETTTTFTINYLVKNKNYIYIVKGYDFSKNEFWWSSPGSIYATK